MRRVLLATPSHDARVSVWFHHSVLDTVRELAAVGIAVHPVTLISSVIESARNDLLHLAISGGYDDILFADSDQEWTPQEALALLEHPVDVVGAPVRKKTEAVERYNVKATNVARDLTTNLLLVDSVGTGFLRLSRKAVIAAWQASQEYADDAGNKRRAVFEMGVVNGRMVGEDVWLCHKLGDLGFRVYLDASFCPRHVGEKKYAGDFNVWLAKYLASKEQSEKQQGVA